MMTIALRFSTLKEETDKTRKLKGKGAELKQEAIQARA